MTSEPGPFDPNNQQPQYPPAAAVLEPATAVPARAAVPNQGYGYPGPPQPAGTNGLAIASLVVSFFCSIVGIILGFVALNQIKRTGQGGRGLAIAGIVIGFASIVIGIAIFAGGNMTGRR